jgi:DNA-binding response OmpR family regulator
MQNAASQECVAAVLPREGSGIGRLILCIDDETEIARILQIRLARHGIEMASASNGRDGFGAAREISPDLILLDLCMPGEDGKQVLARLRTDPLTRTIPVILLTGADVSSVRQRTSPHHPDAFLAKPINFEELLEKIRAHIEIR